eukprot:TRINITY_DN5981_c0_g1_i1.p1 TRINITY_DN5981_c0_g1~~TRINITY_DN5981_c0_g1_i1.p1  ORF type:complete len:582 (-),score=119.89 TRINITY_DN5981_c0_g1_i1:926-2671(-)
MESMLLQLGNDLGQGNLAAVRDALPQVTAASMEHPQQLEAALSWSLKMLEQQPAERWWDGSLPGLCKMLDRLHASNHSENPDPDALVAWLVLDMIVGASSSGASRPAKRRRAAAPPELEVPSKTRLLLMQLLHHHTKLLWLVPYVSQRSPAMAGLLIACLFAKASGGVGEVAGLSQEECELLGHESTTPPEAPAVLAWYIHHEEAHCVSTLLKLAQDGPVEAVVKLLVQHPALMGACGRSQACMDRVEAAVESPPEFSPLAEAQLQQLLCLVGTDPLASAGAMMLVRALDRLAQGGGEWCSQARCMLEQISSMIRGEGSQAASSDFRRQLLGHADRILEMESVAESEGLLISVCLHELTAWSELQALILDAVFTQSTGSDRLLTVLPALSPDNLSRLVQAGITRVSAVPSCTIDQLVLWLQRAVELHPVIAMSLLGAWIPLLRLTDSATADHKLLILRLLTHLPLPACPIQAYLHVTHGCHLLCDLLQPDSPTRAQILAPTKQLVIQLACTGTHVHFGLVVQALLEAASLDRAVCKPQRLEFAQLMSCSSRMERGWQSEIAGGNSRKLEVSSRCGLPESRH